MESPLVSTIAAGLQEELQNNPDPLLEQALIELHRLCATDSGDQDSFSTNPCA
jgi:hypothetical protein